MIRSFFNLRCGWCCFVFFSFSYQTQKSTWWELTKLCLCCSELMSLFTHNWGRKMQIGCNNFSMGMLSVFLFVCFLDLCLFVENFLFAHWNKVQAVALTFPKVWVNTSITVCINFFNYFFHFLPTEIQRHLRSCSRMLVLSLSPQSL